MNFDKIIPSFFILEIEGKAIESIIPGDFGIEKISLGTFDFASDMHATSALKQLLLNITSVPNLDMSSSKESVSFNPEFFPSISIIELTQEQKDQKDRAQELAEEYSEQLSSQNKSAFVIGKTFDPLGDFVESRWIIESPEFKIKGRVAISPEQYAIHKVKMKTFKDEFPSTSSITNIH